MARNKKSEQQNFIQKVVDFLIIMEAKSVTPEIEQWFAQWTLITKYGVLSIILPKEHDTVYTIYCKFMGTREEFKNCPNVNKFSGKLNFHCTQPNLELFKFAIKKHAIDQNETDMIFRVDKLKDFKRNVFAIFPHEVCTYGGLVTTYQHVGQHSGGDHQRMIDMSRLATEEEAKDLKAELKSLGYNINVIKRKNHNKYLKSYREVRGN